MLQMLKEGTMKARAVAAGTVDEVRRLRTRVSDLEAELLRLRSAHDALMASVTVDDDIRMLTLDDQPALT